MRMMETRGGEAVEPKIRVVVADDQRLTRMYVDMFVKSSTRYELVGSLPYAADVLPFCRTHAVDLAILDIVMEQGPDGLTVAAQLKRELPGIRIILATSMAEPEWMAQAQEAGVDSFWYKEYSRLPLLEIMDRTAAGERVYADEPPQAMLGGMPTSELTELQNMYGPPPRPRSRPTWRPKSPIVSSSRTRSTRTSKPIPAGAPPAGRSCWI